MNKAILAATLVASASAGNVHERGYYVAKFHDWLAEHGVSPKNGDDFVRMLQNFADNHDFIESHNAQGKSYTLGHNKFSHMSYEEWRAFVRLGLEKPNTTSDSIFEAPKDMSAVPASIDWTTKGAVTPVKDQGQCGSCWSFSTTGALEGAYQIKYGELISFSEQNLVDCDNFDRGCNGGLMDRAFTWTKKNGGICTEADYPYTSGTTTKAGTCDTSCTKNSKVAPKSHTDITPNSDSAMTAALAQQPVSVAIEADQRAFQLYKSGVFTDECGTNLDHGVLAVGYGTDNGQDFYKVKNSWGTGWGEDGYIRLAKGGNMQAEGQCGILMSASYPTL